MLGWRGTFSRPWQLWGGAVGGVILIVQVFAAAGNAPVHELGTAEKPDRPALASTWRVGVPAAIRVENGRATFRAPTHPRGASVLLIVSSLARGEGPFPISIRAAATNRADNPVLELDETRHAIHSPRAGALPPVPPPVKTPPPETRIFHLLVRDGDVASERNYAPLEARLRAVGNRVQVYVAKEDVGRVGAEVLRDLVETFDERVFPVAASTFGQAEDVDGDGRFTIFLSSWLSRMGQGKHAVDGFVRVADLDRSYAAPFGNCCDMMYLSADLVAGPHLRTIVAHEYTHAVVYSRKTLGVGRSKPAETRVEEEGWLDEALAHLSEDSHGFSRSNLDYRVSAYLSRPELYRLVVDDYYASNLFRSHGNRGSTYLFLRWCTDQFGPGLLPALIGSDQSGLANLESATQASFASLYRRWSLALASVAVGPGVLDPETSKAGFRSIDLRGAVDDRRLAGPRIDRIDSDRGELSWNGTGTSSRFVIVDGKHTGAVEVTISAPSEAELQVTAIPLPEDFPTIDLKARSSYDSQGDLALNLSVLGYGVRPIELLRLAWEPLVPPVDPKLPTVPCGRLDNKELLSYFGTPTLIAGKPVRSTPLKLKGVHRESGAYVLKLVGRDSLGRIVTAWAETNTPPMPPSRLADRDDPSGDSND